MSDLFFTSDEHYGHGNMLKYVNRPFKDLGEQTEALIRNHNSKVSAGSRTYHLGDIFWRTVPVKQALDILYALNGQHYFVWGNHDELLEENEIVRQAFVWCRDLTQIQYLKQKIVLCHYPMAIWRGSHKGTWHLYGHVHDQFKQNNLSLDVGVDSWNYFPVSYEEIQAKMIAKSAMGHCDPLHHKIQTQEWNKETNG